MKPATSSQPPDRKRYRNLKVWQEGHKLVLLVYKKTTCFPKEELYGLASQMRRAAVSVAANIVEGQSRQGDREFLKFLFIASASLAEVEYYLELSRDLKYISGESYQELDSQRFLVGKLLQGLIQSLQKKESL